MKTTWLLPLAAEQKWETVATAGECTSGGVASWLASIQCQCLFDEGPLYSNEASNGTIRSGTLEQYGAVSQQPP